MPWIRIPAFLTWGFLLYVRKAVSLAVSFSVSEVSHSHTTNTDQSAACNAAMWALLSGLKFRSAADVPSRPGVDRFRPAKRHGLHRCRFAATDGHGSSELRHAGLDPLLSGLISVSQQHHLIWIGTRFWIAPDQVVDASPVHEIGADEAGEGERAGDDLLAGLGHAQQQKGD